MRILVTNDDGINAQGLKICEQIARKISDDVWVIAPEHDQSGVSHSLSLNDPLRLRQLGERHYAVKGTPTDCVIMGARHVMPEAPDLVLSGVNRGRNAAEDVLYSGTVAAAKEACVLGIPSFALSQAYTSSSKRSRTGSPRSTTRPTSSRACSSRASRATCWSTSTSPIARPARSRASRCRTRASATSSCCTSTRATTAAAIRISGSPMRAARGRPARTAPISPRSSDNRIAITPLRLDLTDQPFLTKLAELFP